MSYYHEELSYTALDSRVNKVYKYGVNSSTRAHENKWMHKRANTQSKVNCSSSNLI